MGCPLDGQTMGVVYQEGTKPPLIFFPPLKQMMFRVKIINQFERGIKGVS
jgi:hypothetical protein